MKNDNAKSVRIVCLSDFHGMVDKVEVPEGDILILAGDLTGRGSSLEVLRVMDWLRALPHRHKVVVAGNHDWMFQRHRSLAEASVHQVGGVYLEDSGVRMLGLQLWGSPWTPWFYDWAFNARRGADISKHWDLIDPTTDVLITHGPPAGILDRTPRGENAGCEDLLRKVTQIRPMVHVFGHIHEGYGRMTVNGTEFMNVAICDEGYRPVNPVTVVDVVPRASRSVF